MVNRIKPSLWVALGFATGLTACAYLPQTVAGVPDGGGWFSLPLSEWLAEKRGQPLALSACDTCGRGLAVAVVLLSGSEAQEAERVLGSPEALARALTIRGEKRSTVASARPLQSTPTPGFILVLSPADGSKPPVVAAATGRRTVRGLEVVLVVGGDEPGVMDLLRSVNGSVARS
jgi:hypothetical protein